MKSKIFTQLFWADALERAIATAAQVILAIVTVFIPAAALSNRQDLEVAVSVIISSWWLILLAGLGGAGYAILKAIVAAYRAGTDTASLVVDSKPLEK